MFGFRNEESSFFVIQIFIAISSGYTRLKEGAIHLKTKKYA